MRSTSTPNGPGRSSRAKSASCRSSIDRRKFQYLYLSGGKTVMLDPQGRIQIPQNYRERGGLVKDVEIVSMMTYFEIWDKERWAHFQRDNAGPLDDLRERLASKGV